MRLKNGSILLYKEQQFETTGGLCVWLMDFALCAVGYFVRKRDGSSELRSQIEHSEAGTP
jgi:hypothetical protein